MVEGQAIVGGHPESADLGARLALQPARTSAPATVKASHGQACKPEGPGRGTWRGRAPARPLLALQATELSRPRPQAAARRELAPVSQRHVKGLTRAHGLAHHPLHRPHVDRAWQPEWSGDRAALRYACGFFVASVRPFTADRVGEPQGSPVLHRSANPASVCHPSWQREAGSAPQMEPIMPRKSLPARAETSVDRLVAAVRPRAAASSPSLASAAGQPTQQIFEDLAPGSPAERDGSASQILRELWRVSADQLDQTQLAMCSDASDIGLSILENTRAITQSLAVSCGLGETVLAGAGGTSVLESISQTLDIASALINIGMGADAIRCSK